MIVRAPEVTEPFMIPPDRDSATGRNSNSFSATRLLEIGPPGG